MATTVRPPRQTTESSPERLPASLAWARLRFAIIGPLLASPAAPGELHARINELAKLVWVHPRSGKSIQFAAKTIEHWYYQARKEVDPIGTLMRKVPSHAGKHPSISAVLAEAIRAQYHQHSSWSYQLHYDNLKAAARADRTLGRVPGYATLCRFMRGHKLRRMPRRKKLRGPPEDTTTSPQVYEQRERRLYEFTHVAALWHTDFHVGSRLVLTPQGTWEKAHLLAVIDDYSRLCCHAQWYLGEDTASFIHGLCQAFAKRGLVRQLYSDNGSAMIAAETREGLVRLSVDQDTTLPATPEQNAKVECFWAQVEGRLMAMLEGEPTLTLDLLNTATQAWVEYEYNRHRHSELGCSPFDRFLAGPSVARPCPSFDELRRAFRMEVTRKQRHSDGTVTYAGVRYEVPSAYAHITSLTLRVARWDLATIELVDGRSGTHLAKLLPVDKAKNADGRRRSLRSSELTPPTPSGIAPHLAELMAEYAATGLPPAYLPYEHALSVDPTLPTAADDAATQRPRGAS